MALFAAGFSTWRGLVNLPDLLPTHLIIILAMASLATLVVVGFTAWRLFAGVKELIDRAADAARKAASGLARIEQGATELSETAARLQTRNPTGGATPRR